MRPDNEKERANHSTSHTRNYPDGIAGLEYDRRDTEDRGTERLVSKISTPTASATQAVAALPSPVSSQATVNGQCRVGIYDTVTQSFNPLSINTSAGNMFFDAVGEAYQMTLTNTGSSAAEIAGVSAVFYDSEGNEQDRITRNRRTDVSEPGESLTWTEDPWGTWTVELEGLLNGTIH